MLVVHVLDKRRSSVSGVELRRFPPAALYLIRHAFIPFAFPPSTARDPKQSRMHSCFAAEVPVPGDEANDHGRTMLAKLCARDRVMVCGQASSHCVNFSTRDLAAAWKRTTSGPHTAEGVDDEIARRRMGNLVLLKDGMSPVAGFEVNSLQETLPATTVSHAMLFSFRYFLAVLPPDMARLPRDIVAVTIEDRDLLFVTSYRTIWYVSASTIPGKQGGRPMGLSRRRV